MPKKLFKKRRWKVRAKSGDKSKGSLSLSSRLVSTDGIICLILGIACVILLIAAIVIATIHRGGADLHIGTMGVIGFVISLTCFIISVKTLNDEYIAETIPKIAAVVNFVVLLIFMGLYAYGIFIGMV
jgi:hypothetical protein